MLKERVEYLCKRKGITRKELVDGLVTQAHFANILADRYPLPEDLAEQLASRLNVSIDYLTEVARVDGSILVRAEDIFHQLSQTASFVPESYVHELPDRDPALTIELTTALMKAVYYQQLNDSAAYEYIHSSYLNFYLDKYGRPDEVSVPGPLQKALLFYKIQHYRSKHHYHDVLHHVERLLNKVEPGTEIWLTTQNMKMEAYVSLKQFEQAKRVFDDTLRRVYDDRVFHRLSGLYVAYSGYCYAVGWLQEALSALSMAEAHLVYAPNAGEVMLSIMNNRIIMETTAGKYDRALEDITRLQSMVEKEPEETRQLLWPTLTIYRCELALARKHWPTLSAEVEQLGQLSLSGDQHMTLLFYQSQLALSHGANEQFMELALTCLEYYEETQQELRLEQLYEALATICEEGRKYKEAAGYYRKLVYLLRRHSKPGSMD